MLQFQTTRVVSDLSFWNECVQFPGAAIVMWLRELVASVVSSECSMKVVGSIQRYDWRYVRERYGGLGLDM